MRLLQSNRLLNEVVVPNPITPHMRKAHERLIDERLASIIQYDYIDFGAILQKLPGVYPTEVLSSGKRLVSQGVISITRLFQLEDSAKQPVREDHIRRESLIRLPVPHPLDFCWRFGAKAVDFVLSQAGPHLFEGTSILLLGVPSVLQHRADISSRYRIVTIDQDSAVVQATGRMHNVEMISGDVAEVSKFPVLANLIIADPPWYPEHLYRFLHAASSVSTANSVLLLAFPPIGTRPGVHEELKDTLCIAGDMGWNHVNHFEGALPYVTPFFERNALAACDILNIPREWRLGDLHIFRRGGTCCLSALPNVDCEPLWDEVIVNDVRIRVKRVDPVESRESLICGIIKGDILPSVSRRDERRNAASLWTSGNRVFSCSNSSVVVTILKALAASAMPDQIIRQVSEVYPQVGLELTKKTLQQLCDLIALEQKEMGIYY